MGPSWQDGGNVGLGVSASSLVACLLVQGQPLTGIEKSEYMPRGSTGAHPPRGARQLALPTKPLRRWPDTSQCRCAVCQSAQIARAEQAASHPPVVQEVHLNVIE
jgi:hypothetical protein